MKLKKRIKKALASFLQDELLEHMGYNHKIHAQSLNDRFIIEQVPFETIVMEQEVDINPGSGFEHQMRLEQAIDKSKRYFAEEVIKHIHVECQDLLRPEYMMRRSIKLTLKIQSKNKFNN